MFVKPLDALTRWLSRLERLADAHAAELESLRAVLEQHAQHTKADAQLRKRAQP